MLAAWDVIGWMLNLQAIKISFTSSSTTRHNSLFDQFQDLNRTLYRVNSKLNAVYKTRIIYSHTYQSTESLSAREAPLKVESVQSAAIDRLGAVSSSYHPVDKQSIYTQLSTTHRTSPQNSFHVSITSTLVSFFAYYTILICPPREYMISR